ncbi:SCO family protein [Arenibacter sp. GZD96]|uniref:SCO family protein n=1 Tax=Aurantibrevibacter litoralis TaxID=3106030 RepID=UPI002AFF4A1F|nr:SCO family protein [Arenibacter sp. GZD-96]MEA1784622.1 SCO family protein [Arenibacter sp. GZD-96]
MKKNKYTYVWISLVVLVFGIVFIPKIIDRIQHSTTTQNDRLNKKDNAGKLAYILGNNQKRRVPHFAFMNQDSLVVTEKDYRGKVYLVEFFFTTCPSICPLMNKNLVEIQNEFKAFEQFGVASFTINPEHDTPTVLKTYAEEYGITNMDWHLLTGPQNEIYDLAYNGFNFYTAETPDVPGGFEHSGMFALVDKEGYLRSRVDDFGNPIVYYNGIISESQGTNAEGQTQQITILKEDIAKLLNE